MTNKITVNGEYTAIELREMADNMGKEWPYGGCKYYYISDGLAYDTWNGDSVDNARFINYGIYKKRPSQEEVKMVMRRRDILQTWKLGISSKWVESHKSYPVIHPLGLTDVEMDEFREVMSYQYTHHTVK